MLDWQYQYPQYFWLLLLLPLLLLFFFLYRGWKKRAEKKIGDPQLVKELFKDYSPGKTTIKFFLIFISVALGIIALANPRKPEDGGDEVRKGIDVMIALDISNSMLATDIAPNRLLRAKHFISKLLEKMPDDRIGLVLFAGNAYVQMPLTTDHGAARMFVNTATPGTITAQGTDISDALKKADLAFHDQLDRFKSIVVISDGETHDEEAVKTAAELKEKGIMVNTVGIGSPAGATIKDEDGKEKTDASGSVIVSKLNEQLLQEIAASTNGVYVHLTSSEEAVDELMAQLSQIEKKAFGDTSLFNYQTFYSWFAIPMLIFLLMEIFLTDRKKIKA